MVAVPCIGNSTISTSFQFTHQLVYCIGQASLFVGQFASLASKPARTGTSKFKRSTRAAPAKNKSLSIYLAPYVLARSGSAKNGVRSATLFMFLAV